MKKLTVDQIARWGPCQSGPGEMYSREGLRKLFGGKEISAVAIADLPIPPADKLWVWLRPGVIDERDLRLLTVLFVGHVLPIFEAKYPAEHSVRECLRIMRSYALGGADETALSAAAAAAAAATTADASAATAAAATAAAAAAYADAIASDASYAAAYAERTWQVEQVRAYLAGELDLLAATEKFGPDGKAP